MRAIWVLLGLIGSMYAQTFDAHFDQKKAQSFVNHMVKSHHFDRHALVETLAHVPYDASVIRLMNRPYEAMPWPKYLHHFISSRRILFGLKTWRAHRETLAQLQATYHVPASVIVAILGMESYYGRYQSTHSTLKALTTLSFAYPKRSHFFTSELEALFLLARKHHFDVTQMKGSYAGALGMPQFMPSNYLRYAKDMDHHHHADLFHNMDDSMGSIAVFLHHFGAGQCPFFHTPACAQIATIKPPF